MNEQSHDSNIEIVITGVKNPAEPPQREKVVAQEAELGEAGQEQKIGSCKAHMLGLGEAKAEELIREHVEKIMHDLHQGGEESCSEEIEESNVSKESSLSENNNKQKAKSQCESNDERKEELPTSRKCFNKLCASKKIYKKIRSRVEDNKYRFFCKNCYENYFNNLYCEFCEQIYSNNSENEDDDKWIGCDNCERWNHIECEKKFRDKNIHDLRDKNLLYECLVCAQKSRANADKNKKVEKEEEKPKVKVEINRDQRTLIFHKKNENFPNLEYFLQNYSFRLWMNESQIREDIEHLRTSCLRAPQEEVVKNKFKKIKD